MANIFHASVFACKYLVLKPCYGLSITRHDNIEKSVTGVPGGLPGNSHRCNTRHDNIELVGGEYNEEVSSEGNHAAATARGCFGTQSDATFFSCRVEGSSGQCLLNQKNYTNKWGRQC